MVVLALDRHVQEVLLSLPLEEREMTWRFSDSQALAVAALLTFYDL